MLRTIVLILGMAHSTFGMAEPIAASTDGNVTVTLYNEPCAMPAVANLPMRATWKEGNTVNEGCWSAGGGLVLMYFDDRSVVGAAASSFQRVTAM